MTTFEIIATFAKAFLITIVAIVAFAAIPPLTLFYAIIYDEFKQQRGKHGGR